MQLVLIRHAESFNNIGTTEDLDSSLSNNGFTQMEVTARWLKNIFSQKTPFENFIGYTSPLLRCLQTSRVLSHIIKVPFEVNYKLREFSVTKENSISPCVTIRNRKDIYDFSWIEDKKEICFKDESLAEFVPRVKSFYSNLDPKGKYLIVSHGSVCRCLHALATNTVEILFERYSNFDFEENTSIKNCGITFIRDNKEIMFSKTIY